MSAPVRLAVPLALALLLPGCIFQPGQDDLSGVCERKSTSPAQPYTVDGIERFTEVRDENLTGDAARRILAAVQPNVITLAGARHANFSATLAPTEYGWRFTGIGRAADGSVVDTYVYDVLDDPAGVTVTPLKPTVGEMLPPESLVSAAWSVANATPELASAKTRTPTLVAAGWDRNVPACVKLLFQDGPDDAVLPASPEHPHTLVVVSFSSHSVVLIKREGWSA